MDKWKAIKNIGKLNLQLILTNTIDDLSLANALKNDEEIKEVFFSVMTDKRKKFIQSLIEGIKNNASKEALEREGIIDTLETLREKNMLYQIIITNGTYDDWELLITEALKINPYFVPSLAPFFVKKKEIVDSTLETLGRCRMARRTFVYQTNKLSKLFIEETTDNVISKNAIQIWI